MAIRLSNGDIMVADDLVQDAWIRAMGKLDTFQWKSTLRTWLVGILVFRWREHLRQKNIELRYFEPMENVLVTADTRPYPDMQIDIGRTLAQLPIGYRTILTLHDLEGYRHEDIADMLDIAVGTCKSQLHHARKAFRKLYT